MAHDPLQGRLLGGRYRVTGRLGRGAFGEVVAADQESLGLRWRRVALKLFTHDHVTADNAGKVFGEALLLERLAEEARAGGREASLVAVLDVGVLRDYRHTPFVALEYVDGGSLRDRLRAAGALPLATVLRFAREICAGLALAHGASPPIIHRDVKPENVLLTRAGAVRLADFGLAIDRYQAFLDSGQAGTVGYMPPESREGIPASPAFDVYSLGVMMLELVTGDNPLISAARRALEPGRSPDGELARAQERLARLENPATGRKLAEELAELKASPPFQELLAGCLAPSPGARFADARALDAALERCQPGGDNGDRDDDDPPVETPAERGERLLRQVGRHLARGELAAAREPLAEAASLLPRDPRVCFQQSRLDELENRLEESIRAQRRGLRLDRSGPEQERLADLLERAGRSAEARAARRLARVLGAKR